MVSYSNVGVFINLDFSHIIVACQICVCIGWGDCTGLLQEKFYSEPLTFLKVL